MAVDVPCQLERHPIRWPDILHPALLAAALAATVLLSIRVLGVPGEALVGDVVVDDAFYYLVPARHLLAGDGYSFDGEKRTNGVQPLWAVVAVALTAAVRDEFGLIRSLAGASGVLWILAGWVLYRTLRSSDRWLALFVAAGWWWTSFWGRLAFQGMENGLHAFLASLLLRFGVRRLARPTAAQTPAPARLFFMHLGLLLALFTLARVDGALLALLLGAAVLCGLIRPDGRARCGLNLSGAMLLTLPGAVLVGGYCWLSYRYFGVALPLSGAVKLHFEHEWGWNHGGVLGTLAWHFRFMAEIAADVLRPAVAWLPWFRNAPAARSAGLLLAVCGAGALGLVCAALRRPGQRTCAPQSAWRIYAALLVLFAGAHLAAYALALPHFTAYATWYFAPELMTLWVALGVLLYAAGALPGLCIGRPATRAPQGGRVCCATAVLLLLVAAGRTVSTAAPRGPATNAFMAAGRWVERNVPAGEKVSAFSAGILGYFAAHHQTVNLDGLMNDRTYFRDYLAAGQIPRYARERHIDYLCDYAPLAAWRSGGFWGIALDPLQLVYWQRMGGDLGYAIWKLHPEVSRADFLAPCAGYCDRVAQVQYAAEVLGRFHLVDAEDPTALAPAERGDAWVFTSIVEWPDRRLRHVLLTPAEADAVQLCPAWLQIARPQSVTFGHAVRLLGVDVPVPVCARGARLIVTRYWQKLADGPSCPDAALELWLDPAAARTSDHEIASQLRLHSDRGCHGTHPLQQWRPNEVVAETYSIPVPTALSPGSYPLLLGIHDTQTGWVLPDVAGASAAQPLLFLMNIELR